MENGEGTFIVLVYLVPRRMIHVEIHVEFRVKIHVEYQFYVKNLTPSGRNI